MQESDQRTLLGGMTARKFLARHWQRLPRLIRGAVPGFDGLLDLDELFALACRDDVRSRLVLREGRQWHVEHGPFSRSALRRLPERGWSLLVHDVNHYLPQARALIDRFNFIGYARLDDLMISYAPAGAGIGPHVDSYDVFLLQGPGRRRWQISHQRDLRLREDQPLKLLRAFEAEQEWMLDPGDMLYLPPGWAHDGVSVEPSMTYSIGFRAPSWQELAVDFLRHLEDQVALEGMYQDPGLEPARGPARLAPRMVSDIAARLDKLRWREGEVTQFLGRRLTEPKEHVVFEAPQPALARRPFSAAARRHGVKLDLRTQMLYNGARFFINGESAQVSGRAAATLRRLADTRVLLDVDASQRGLVTLLHEWYGAGWLHIPS